MHIWPRLQRETGVRGKDLGVTRLWIVVEKMRVDGIGEGACVW